MTIQEMKLTLANKLKDEQTYFTKNDINIKKVKNKYIITIKDYEYITFKLSIDNDDKMVFISKYYDNEFNDIIIDSEGTTDNDIKYVLVYLGYHIANTF